MKWRSFHRIFGIVLFLFLVNATVSGVLRANAKSLYWKDRKPLASTATRLAPPAVSVAQVFEIYKKFSPQESIAKLQLKFFLDREMYLLETSQHDQKYILIDANSGQVSSPISRETAESVARLYVDSTDQVILFEQLPAFKARKSSEPRPAYRFQFNDRQQTEVFIDRDTGEMIWLLDHGRRMSVWVNRLHELDFAGLSRVALSVLGVAIILLSVSGLFLAIQTRKR